MSIPQSASLTAPVWRVSAANLEGRQNLFCAPKPQPGKAEGGAESWREGFSPTSGCRFRRTPARVPTAGTTLWDDNPSVSFLYTREPFGGAAVGENTQGSLGKRRGRKHTRESWETPWAKSWRVSAANLKGQQNLFCAPEPQPGEAEGGAQTHKGAFWKTAGDRNTQKNLRHVLSRHRKPAAPAPQITAKIMPPTAFYFFIKFISKLLHF